MDAMKVERWGRKGFAAPRQVEGRWGRSGVEAESSCSPKFSDQSS